MLDAMKPALREAGKAFLDELALQRALHQRGICRLEAPAATEIDGRYLVTSELGIYRLDKDGIAKVFDLPTFGIAAWRDYLYLGIQQGAYTSVLRVSRKALGKPGARLECKLVYRLRVGRTNERIHQLCASDDFVWVANTGRNTLLRIDPNADDAIEEYTVFLDRFGAPIHSDVNHINSVHSHGNCLLFVAYKIGKQSMIGILHDGQIEGYAYPRKGVHDIYLTREGFMFSDTFGENTDEKGGVPVTEKGPMDPERFAKPPGYIVRGIAGQGSEMIIGHSHKGKRAKRFEGRGALLIYRDRSFVTELTMPCSQVYQIMREDGKTLDGPDAVLDVEQVRRRISGSLGEVIYRAPATPV